MSRSATPPRILIIGLSAAGAAGLPAQLLARIEAADLLAGGRRQLGYFPTFTGEQCPIEADIDAVAARLKQAQADGQQAVVLASGDPLCFGIGASLRRYFAAEALEIIPAATAFQLAFAALAEPWSDALLLSAHARPLNEVVTKAQTAPKAAILTDNRHTPPVIAQALLAAGFAPDSPCAVCENLGGDAQRIVRAILSDVGRESYAPLNVFIVWRHPTPDREETLPSSYAHPAPPVLPASIPPGLPDEAFATAAGQITKREIRLLSLAELQLKPGGVMWDIGAGSGAVGIEAARAVPTATVYAVEKRADFFHYAQENLTRFPAPNLHLWHGVAPEVLAGWPDPDAVFIGGSGGRLAELIAAVQLRLRPGGRLVINLATLENLAKIRSLLPTARVTQVQISRGVPILDMVRLEALNPVFVVVWSRER